MWKGHTIEIPPHGFVRYIDHLGTDLRIVEAARISYQSPSKGPEQDKKLLFYLYRNRHTSPFEQCSITFNIRMPIFVMRQFVRHRTFRLNEVSGRYSELPADFYVPAEWRGQAKSDKQGSESLAALPQHTAAEIMGKVCSDAYAAYQRLLELGVAKEMARFVLPVAIYTEIYVNCDLHNLMHFLTLRQSEHAQREIQDVVEAMRWIAAELFPWTFEAFETYELTMTPVLDSL